MSSKPSGLLVLTVTSIFWMAWSGGTLGVVFPGEVSRFQKGTGGQADHVQEPPFSHEVWDFLQLKRFPLFQRKPIQLAQERIGEAVTSMGAQRWHQEGYRGQGIKIAVLDSGFRGYDRARGKVLPGQLRTRSFRKDGKLDARDSQHGILCGEVIHHLAPEAELLLANWEPEQPSSFLEAVRWARQEGAHILSCSVIMPSWSDGEGGGAHHAALRNILGEGLFFACAGNTAQRHWSGPVQPNAQGWQQWAPGKVENVITPFSEERVSIEWTSSADLEGELILVEVRRGVELQRVRSRPGEGYATAVLRFVPHPTEQYALRVRFTDKKRSSGRFHLTVLGGKMHFSTTRSSIPFPGDGAEVIAVGAVDGKGRRVSYSSCGPCGTVLKPDLVARVPFPSEWRPEQPFSGTSAAAPQAAALAALIWSRWPQWRAAQVREQLFRAAGKGRVNPSFETGYGIVRLP